MKTSKGTEMENKEGATEIKVETVGYRSPPGTDGQPPQKEDVEIIHQIPAEKEAPPSRAVAAAASKVATEMENKEGATEIKVETVDYRSPPGTDGQPPQKEDVEIIHQIPAEKEAPPPGAVAAAASKVAETIQSAKEKISSAAGGTAGKD